MKQGSLQRTERVCEGFSKSRCGKLRGSVKDVVRVAGKLRGYVKDLARFAVGSREGLCSL
jgi:hypothetical protein